MVPLLTTWEISSTVTPAARVNPPNSKRPAHFLADDAATPKE